MLLMHQDLVSTSGLSCKEAEKGMVWLSLAHCKMLDYMLVLLIFSYH